MEQLLRIGYGEDIHRLVEGRKLILGGVEIPYVKGLLGHSDADVVIHALMDALLGAAAKGDIGQHFPDTDAKYEGMSSLIMLKTVVEVLNEDGYQINNVDISICAEKPKLMPHIQKMRENIAKALFCDAERISVKAMTNEGLDAIGRGEAIKAICVCILTKAR